MNVWSPFTDVPNAIEKTGSVRMVVVVDDDDYENEGDPANDDGKDPWKRSTV